MIKKENKRITVTLKPRHVDILNRLSDYMNSSQSGVIASALMLLEDSVLAKIEKDPSYNRGKDYWGR